MFGIKMNPEQIFGLLSKFGLEPEKLLPKIEAALLQEAEKTERETGKRVFLVAAPTSDGTEYGKFIKVSLYVEGETPGDLQPYKSLPFAEILNLFKNLENETENEFTPSIGAGGSEAGAANGKYIAGPATDGNGIA